MKKEINEEFEEYSNVNYEKNYSIGEIFQHFDNKRSFERNFSVVKKQSPTNTEFQIKRNETIKLFAYTLINFGNLKYAIKTSGIGEFTAIYYIDVLNNAALKRGLPLIFVRKKQWNEHAQKLTKKQVSYIKYLATKYSSKKIAKMYNVTASTILAIKNKMTWKRVKPAILNQNPVTHVNKNTTIKGSERYNKNDDLYPPEIAAQRFETVLKALFQKPITK